MIRRAHALTQQERVTIAMLTQDDVTGCFVLSVHYWRGIDGSGERIVPSTHATREAARKYFDTLPAIDGGAVLIDLCGLRSGGDAV